MNVFGILSFLHDVWSLETSGYPALQLIFQFWSYNIRIRWYFLNEHFKDIVVFFINIVAAWSNYSHIRIFSSPQNAALSFNPTD